MSDIKLVIPSKEHEQQVMDFIKEFKDIIQRYWVDVQFAIDASNKVLIKIKLFYSLIFY